MQWSKRYSWRRTWGDETGIDGKKHEDYSAYDGQQYAGRIRLETAGPTKGKWQWAGSAPNPLYGRPPMPNVGYSATAAEAACAVETYWDAAKVVRDERLRQRKSPDA